MSKAILKSPIHNNTWALAFLLTLVALMYGIFEIWTEQGDLTELEQTTLANEAINTALQNYLNFEQEFVNQSNQFSVFAKQQLQNNEPLSSITTEADKEYDFWGISLFKGNENILWTGFSPQQVSPEVKPTGNNAYVSIEQSNNVTFLNYSTHITAQLNDTLIQYTVITRKKVKQ